MLQVMHGLVREKLLHVRTVGRDSFSNPEIVKLFTLSDHGAQERRAYAATQISHDIEKSRSVRLLFPQ